MKQSNIENGILILTSALSIGGLVPGFQILEVASIGISSLYELNKGKIFSPNIPAELEESLNKVIENTIKDTIKEIKISDGSFILDNLQAILQNKNEKKQLSQSFTYPQLQETINESLNKITKEENLYLSQQEKQKFLIELNQSFLLQLSQYPDIGVYLAHKNLQSLQQEIDELRQQIQSITQKRIYLNFPYPPAPTTTFLGRETFIETIHQQLDKTNLNIYAMGGLGKTDTVLYYIQQYRQKYQQIIFFNYQKDIATTLSEHLVIEEREIFSDILNKAIYELISLDQNTLIIFDDISTINDEDAKFLSQLQAKVIVTARGKKLINGFKNQKIDFLPKEKCKELFIQFLDIPIKNYEEDELEKIITRTGRHTLAIKLLAKIYNHSFAIKSLSQLNQELDKKGFDIQEFVKVQLETKQQEMNFYNHMQALFDITEIINEDQIYVLKNICILPSRPIEGYKILEWLELESQEPIDKLFKTGWIEIENKKIVMHSVIVETLKKKLHIVIADCEILIKHLTDEIQYENFNYDRYFAPYLIHCLFVIEPFFDKEILNENLANLYSNIGFVLISKGYLPLAKEFTEKSLHIKDIIYGKYSENSFKEYVNLIAIYGLLRYDIKSLHFGFEIIENYDQTEENYMAFANIFNTIAIVLLNGGQKKIAKYWFFKSLHLLRKNYKENILYIASTYLNLSMYFDKVKEYSKAFQYIQNALSIFEKYYISFDIRLMDTYNNLGLIYSNLNFNFEGIKNYKTVLKIAEKNNALDNFNIAFTYINLGDVYNKINKNKIAHQYYREGVLISIKTITIRHYLTREFLNKFKKNYLALDHTEQEFNQYLSDLLSNPPPPPTQED